MLGWKAGFSSCLRAAEDRSDVDGAMDREAGAAKAAVCRSREERSADAMSSSGCVVAIKWIREGLAMAVLF